jgi:phage shock protein A
MALDHESGKERKERLLREIAEENKRLENLKKEAEKHIQETEEKLNKSKNKGWW